MILAPPLLPDPAPPGHGPIHFVSYDFTAKDRSGRFLLRCHVPAHGKRLCVIVKRIHR